MPVDRLLCVVAAALVGAALIAVSAGRLWASAELVPVAQTLWVLERGGSATYAELEGAHAALTRSLAHNPSDADRHDARGATLLALAAFAAPESSERAERYVQARRSFGAAVARAPQNSAMWARLAEATAHVEGFSPRSMNALQMSYLTGRRDFRVLALRISLSFRYWESLPVDLREEARRQVNAMWERRPSRDALFQLYTNLGYAERRLLRDLLSDQEADMLPRFDRELRRWLKRRAPDRVRQQYLR